MNSESSFPAKLSHLPQILDWVRKQLESTPLDEAKKKQVELALEEAVVNVIHHGAAKTPLELKLSCSYEPSRQIAFDLSDPGPPFNPLTHPEPSTDTPLEEREIGGLGLTFMRKCMDALFYRREEHQNILTLIKNIEV